VVDQVGGGLDHASGAAGGTEAALLAGKGHEQFVPTAIALHADEAVLHAAAGEVTTELVEHERGQRTLAFGKPTLEGREVLLDEAIQDGFFFRAMALVAHPVGDR